MTLLINRREYRELWQLRATLELEENQSNPNNGSPKVDKVEMSSRSDSFDSVSKPTNKYESGWFSADSG